MLSNLRSEGAVIAFYLPCSFLLGTKTCKVQLPTVICEGIILVFTKMVYIIKKRCKCQYFIFYQLLLKPNILANLNIKTGQMFRKIDLDQMKL